MNMAEESEISIESNESVLSQESNISASSQTSFRSLKPNQYRELQFEFITGWRANSKTLCAEDNFYNFNAKTSLGPSWLCTHTVGGKRVCSVRVYIVDGMCIQLVNCGAHNHPNKLEDKRQLFILNEAKRRCANLDSFLATARVTVRSIWNQVMLE